MGILSSIEKEPEVKKSSATPWRNVALRVSSYDIDNGITNGVDISTGETLRIKLDDNNRPGREGVETWSQERFREKKGYRELANPKAVVAGDESEAGVIIFEAVRPTNTEGLLEARWAVTAAHSAADANVIPVMARPIPADERDPRAINPALGIEVVRPITSAAVSSLEEISEHVTNILQTPFTQAVVRAQDEDGVILYSVVRRPFTDELKALTAKVNAAGEEMRAANKPFAEINRAKSKRRTELAAEFVLADQKAVEQALPNFYQFDRMGKLFATMTPEQLQTLKIEVFSLEKIYPGSKYKESLCKDGGVDSRSFRRDFCADDGLLGFSSAIVALRVHEEGGTQFTKIRVDSTRPMLYMSLKDIPTANIQPRVAPVVANQAAADSQSESSEPPPSMASVDELSSKLASASRAYARR